MTSRPRSWYLSPIIVVLVAMVVTTAPVSAATAVASIHTTDTDFNNANTLSDVTISGSGTTASVALDENEVNYNVVNAEGDGTIDTATAFVGDEALNNDPLKTEIRLKPDGDQNVTNITVDIQTTSGSDYGFKVDIYAVQEQPDGTYGEGTKVVTDWDPSFSTGEQTVELDTQFSVEAGEDWTLEFITDSSNNNNGADALNIKVDDSASNTWIRSNKNGQLNQYGDVAITGTASALDGRYISQNHTASQVEDAFTNLTLTDANATVEWQYWDGSSWQVASTNTYTSGGNKSVDVTGHSSAQKWRANVTFQRNGSIVATAELHDEGVQFNATQPTIDNSSATPSGGSQLSTDQPTLKIDVNDTDFSTAQSDELTVTFKVKEPGTSSFSSVGTDTLTSNGTGSFQYSATDGGDYQWNVTVEDDYGESLTSSTFNFSTPQNVTIRNESNASQIVTGANVTITFFSVDGKTIVEKSDNNGDGNISLSGLPITEFVAVVEADGFYSRRVYIGSLFEQNNIYVLNSTAFPQAKSTDFVYEDRTGEFPQDNTVLKIQRAVDVNNNGTFEWQTVAGDFWGAAGEFPFTGETNARYRLIIENTNTNTQRNLGTHIPTSDSRKTIVVGRLDWPALNATGRVFNATQTGSTIPVAYQDPSNNTTEVRIRVYELNNASNEIYDQNFTTGPYGTLQTSVSLTSAQEDKSWVVNYTAETSDDGTVNGEIPVGASAFSLPVDPWLLGTLSWIFLTFTVCLYGPRTVTIGAWTTIAVAGGLMLFQWVNIPIASYVTTILIAAGATWYREATP